MSYDFAAYDKDGRLSIVVEAKRQLGTNSAWATMLRRNILAHGGGLQADFFMVVVPDKLYVWKGAAQPQAEPTVIDAHGLFAPYFQQTGVSAETIEPAAFEQVVAWWLSDLARGVPPEIDPQLIRSGIVGAVSGGRVLRQLAA